MNGHRYIAVERLAARGLRPVAELAASRPHGDRLRYMAGCKCPECRRANSRYECERQKARRTGDWNGIVSAAEARAHIRSLSRQGIGRRAIGAASDVGDSILHEIKSGTRKRIRARTSRRILAVTPAMASDGAHASAKRTWKLISLLLEEGYTKTFLAERLGSKAKTPALQLGRERVTVRSAARVESLYRELTT